MHPNLGFDFKPVPSGMFRSVTDLMMYIGMLVVGGMIFLYALKNIVKELYEYVRDRLSTSRKDLQ